MKSLCSIFIFFSLQLVPVIGSADYLGSSFNCTGKTLTFKGKKVTSGSSRSQVAAQIAALRSQLKFAKSVKKKNQINAKIVTAKALFANVKLCASGSYVQKIFTTIAAAYPNGNWNNTTFSTTGGISGNMSFSGKLLVVSINIGGSMFGALTPGPVEFQHDVGGATFPLNFTVTGTSIGDLDITISSNGDLHVDETVVPSLPNILRATLDATFTSGTYSGTFHSFLVGNAQLAQGVMSMSR